MVQGPGGVVNAAGMPISAATYAAPHCCARFTRHAPPFGGRVCPGALHAGVDSLMVPPNCGMMGSCHGNCDGLRAFGRQARRRRALRCRRFRRRRNPALLRWTGPREALSSTGRPFRGTWRRPGAPVTKATPTARRRVSTSDELRHLASSPRPRATHDRGEPTEEDHEQDH
jgi:hypothetical protein